MDFPIIARYRWDADELFAGLCEHRKKNLRPLFRSLRNAVIAFAVIIVVFAIYYHEWKVVGLGTVGLLWFLLSDQISRWQIRRKFRQRPSLAGEIAWQISEERVVMDMPIGRTESSWSAFTEAAQATNGMLLYPDSSIFLWLPRHGFQDDAAFEAFQDLVKRKITKYVIVR